MFFVSGLNIVYAVVIFCGFCILGNIFQTMVLKNDKFVKNKIIYIILASFTSLIVIASLISLSHLGQ